MTKPFLNAIVSVLVFIYSSSIAFANSEIEIVYVSKMSEVDTRENQVGGLAELDTFIKQTRQSNPHTLFLHGGDFLSGSLMSSFDKGTHMIDILNRIEPDAVALNEREFAFREDELSLRIQSSAFPYLNSNIIDPLTGGRFESVEESMCYEMGERNICVFAVLDPNVIESYPPDRIQVDSDVNKIKEQAISLRKNGADLVIIMASHAENALKKMLEDKVIDLVLYSNSNEDLIEPIGQGMFVQQGTETGKAIRVTVNNERNINPQFNADIISLNNYQPDPQLNNKIHYYLSMLDRIMDAPVGKTLTEMNSKHDLVRTEESAMGNLVADALRNYYQADIAFVNGGSIRGNRHYPAGVDLTRKDIQSELPFDPPSIFLVASGKDIMDSLENGLSMIDQVKGRFLQVSGLNMVWCPQKPVGKRVQSVLVDGEPIELDKNYTLATSEYLYKGGDGYSMLKDNLLIRSKKVKLILWELVRAYVGDKEEVSPEIEGRILQRCNK